MPKRVNERKIISDLKKELGLREERVKEFGFIEAESDDIVEVVVSKDNVIDVDEAENVSLGRTRSGRRSRPPKRILGDIKIKEERDEIKVEVPELTSGAVTNMNMVPPPLVEQTFTSLSRRTFVPPARYICKVCGKVYLGDKKMARHLRYFPDHGFATPEPPTSPGLKKPFSPEAWINESEPSVILNQVGPKLFQSFTLWDLLVKKVSLKQLGTAEVLSSMFADIQALVMDLKNMVEQCLTNLRTNDDSFSVVLTPMISSILGQSQNGGVERFVLPYNQIPVHYHMLLGFPMGLKNTRPADVFSPDSTNSIFHPEEDNSQMSLSSDINDRPLVDKVVLEANLGSSQADMDEETQDSSVSSKRPRLDSESQSVTSPPPQTPDFLTHEEESNMSSTSNVTTKDIEQSNMIESIPVKDFVESDLKTEESAINSIRKNLIELTSRSASKVPVTGAGSITESTRTKLPSFSSIICGSPKPSGSASEDKIVDGSSEPSNNLHVVTTGENINSNVDNFQLKNMRISDESLRHANPSTTGGSAPVSPGMEYIRSLNSITSADIGFQRRGSVDQVLTHTSVKLLNSNQETSSTRFSPGKGIDMVDSAQLLSNNIITGDLSGTDNTLPPNQADQHSTESCRRFSYSEGDEVLQEMMKVSMPVPVTSPFQISSDNAVFNVTTSSMFNTTNKHSFLETPPKDQMVGMAGKSYSAQIGDSFHGRNLKETLAQEKTLKKQFPGLDLLIEKSDSFYTKYSNSGQQGSSNKRVDMMRPHDFESSTQVTFSDLNHPIPSVSPMKETIKEYDCSKSARQQLPTSQSPNLFNDLESVLNESDEFSFHSALSANVENVPSKTPEKLLTSVPPSVIMNNKKTSLMFESFDYDKADDISSLDTSLQPLNVITTSST